VFSVFKMFHKMVQSYQKKKKKDGLGSV